MKNLQSKNKDKFRSPEMKFNALVQGSKMSQFANLLLILFSIGLMIYSRENLVAILFLSLGIVALAVYTLKFLLLKNIHKKPESTFFSPSNVLNFKAYMAKRKRNEVVYMTIWMISTIPAVSLYLNSGLKASILVATSILIMMVLGFLSFKKIEDELKSVSQLLKIER